MIAASFWESLAIISLAIGGSILALGIFIVCFMTIFDKD